MWYNDPYRTQWHYGCWPNCPAEGPTLDELFRNPEINSCVKPKELKCGDISEKPFSKMEQEQKTSRNGIKWTCSDGNNIGSVCEKECVNHHLPTNGFLAKDNRFQCVCKEKSCNWEHMPDHVYRVTDEVAETRFATTASNTVCKSHV